MTNPTSVRELAERLWTGDTSSGEVHPVHTAYPEGEEIADGVLYFKGVASVNTIDTGDALVMLDTGTKQESKRVFELVRSWRPDTLTDTAELLESIEGQVVALMNMGTTLDRIHHDVTAPAHVLDKP
ncbi:MAG: hypothetical protein WED87_05540, partial [Dehalococcoidia bacterium]